MGLAAFNRQRRDLAAERAKEQEYNKAAKPEKPKRSVKGGEKDGGE